MRPCFFDLYCLIFFCLACPYFVNALLRPMESTWSTVFAWAHLDSIHFYVFFVILFCFTPHWSLCLWILCVSLAHLGIKSFNFLLCLTEAYAFRFNMINCVFLASWNQHNFLCFPSVLLCFTPHWISFLWDQHDLQDFWRKLDIFL